MSDETAIVETKPEPEPIDEISVHLVARNPKEMAAAKASMEEWLQGKKDMCTKEADDLFRAYETAKKSKWNTVTLLRHYGLAQKREQFYAKALTVVKAGYTLIPNFPVDIFAMRVSRSIPMRKKQETSSYSTPNPYVPEPVALPEGEGRYVHGSMVKRYAGTYTETKDGKEIKKYFSRTTGYCDVEFPVIAAQSEVMTATQEAMALRVFDAIGICPPQRKGDPLIIGQIRMPKQGWTDPKILSFLIAWHLDLRTL